MIRIYGFPLYWLGDCSNILEEEYGVKLVGVAGCVVSKKKPLVATIEVAIK